MLKEIIAKNLKRLRWEQRLSQQQAADKIGIARQSYSRLEHGIHDVRLGTLEKMAKIFNVTAIELLTKHEEDENQ